MDRSVALLLVLVFLTASCIIIPKPALSSADVAGDFWASKASMQQARCRLGVAVVEGKIYAIGGDDPHLSGNCLTAESSYGHPLDINEIYDPGTNTWTTKAPMLTPRTDFGVAVYQGKIYCIGGLISNSSGYLTPTNVNEVYDPSTNTWETKTPMPTSSHSLQANVADGKIYLIGGYLGLFAYTASAINQVYNPVNDSWTTETPMPHSVCGSASVAVDDKIYFLGGWSAGSVQIYDTKVGTWSLGAPTPRYALSSVAGSTTSVNAPQKIYLFDESSTQVYDLTNDSWSNATTMPTARGYARVAVVNDTFYVLGGVVAPFEGYIVITAATAANEQYTSIGDGTIPPSPSSSPSPSPSPSQGPTSISSPEPQQSEPFSTTWLIAGIVIVTVFSVGLMVNFAKNRKKTASDTSKGS